jgi:hypothetical protein
MGMVVVMVIIMVIPPTRAASPPMAVEAVSDRGAKANKV